MKLKENVTVGCLIQRPEEIAAGIKERIGSNNSTYSLVYLGCHPNKP